MRKFQNVAVMALALTLGSCGGDDGNGGAAPTPTPTVTPAPTPTPTPVQPSPLPISTTAATSTNGLMSVKVEKLATFETPYAVAPLADGQALFLEAFNGLKILHLDGTKSAPVSGTPRNFYYAFDVILAPDYRTSRRIFISYCEFGPDRAETGGSDDGRGDGANLAVLSGTLTIAADGSGSLSDVNVVWRQKPRMLAAGEFGGHMAFSPDGRYLFITAGDRSSFDPSQDNANTLGKIVRIFPDGTIPTDNPYVGDANLSPDIWTTGHRNPYGLAFDASGKLWEHEHGPKGGDEMNLIKRAANFGWPKVSWGTHYDDGPIANPAPGDGFVMPTSYWTPAIAPSGMIIYNSALLPRLKGLAVIGGLKSEGLVLVQITGETTQEVDRLPLGARIRDVRQGPDGAIWVVEDQPAGNLLRIVPN